MNTITVQQFFMLLTSSNWHNVELYEVNDNCTLITTTDKIIDREIAEEWLTADVVEFSIGGYDNDFYLAVNKKIC